MGNKRTELGCAGHLCVASMCQFTRHTQVGNKFRVSTVGDYTPPHKEERETLGASEDSFFETMVFETDGSPAAENEGCGCRAVISWSELDSERYASAGEAQEGHEIFVRKYMKLARENNE